MGAAALFALLLVTHLAAQAVTTRDDNIPRWMKTRYESALLSFRVARFAEAYGRFIELAEAGHTEAARHALWMCEMGPVLFGRPWDCAPDEIAAWSRLIGVEPHVSIDRIYPAFRTESRPRNGGRCIERQPPTERNRC
jgi:hypothetical protein